MEAMNQRRKSWYEMVEEEEFSKPVTVKAEKCDEDDPSVEEKTAYKDSLAEPMDVDERIVKTEPKDDYNEENLLGPLQVSNKDCQDTDPSRKRIEIHETVAIKDEGNESNLVSIKKEVEEPSSVNKSVLVAIKKEVEEPPSVSIPPEIQSSHDNCKITGAESGWAKLVGVSVAEKPKTTPGKLTFAQICAKSSNSPISTSSSVECSLKAPDQTKSPEKRERKRSLFPHGSKDNESFGILDEKSMDSPCKDLREIMTNIHMDSPLKQDENADTCRIRRTSPRKAALGKGRDLREALKSPNKGESSRKRGREKSKGHDSPATKMAHISESPPSKSSSPRVRASKLQYETDKETLARRQKQIEYGKNTLGYQRYIKLVPKETREKRHPKTPPRQLRYSRRAWDGLVKVWRQKLHFWDPPKEGEETPTELPESWDHMSDYSASFSDSTSEKSGSVPSTPRSGRKRAKSHSD